MTKLLGILAFFTTTSHAAICAVAPVGPIFNYSPISSTATQQVGNVQLTCTSILAGEVISYQIKFSAGSSNSYSTRTLKFASENLNYNLYKLNSCQQILGDGVSSSTVIIGDAYNASLGTNTRNYPIYGCIAPLQNVNAGIYTDTITVTIDY